MKLEDQVCTRKQGERLKELGITAKAHFSHVIICPDPIGNSWYADIIDENHPMAPNCEMMCDAFTAAEILLMLPDYSPALGNLEIGKGGTDHATLKPRTAYWYNVSYWHWISRHSKSGDCYLEKRSEHLQQAETLAQALAAMLIYLLESHLITAAEVNTRL